jgi:hypothetical protein
VKLALGLVFVLALLCASGRAWAGPPYLTDDPEPVKYRHWEFYLATQHTLARDGATGTAPHVEVNYGVLPNLQIHAIVPLGYARPTGGPTHYGLADCELGAKLRFIQEGAYTPMIGTFPMLEIPLGSAAKGLGTEHWHGFLPVWLQKSLGPWSTYGGGGYGINPGAGNRNFWAFGWQGQRRLSESVALGGELFYSTTDHDGGRDDFRFNIGLVLDLTSNHHVLASIGRSIHGDTLLQGYLAYQLTL